MYRKKNQHQYTLNFFCIAGPCIWRFLFFLLFTSFTDNYAQPHLGFGVRVKKPVKTSTLTPAIMLWTAVLQRITPGTSVIMDADL